MPLPSLTASRSLSRNGVYAGAAIDAGGTSDPAGIAPAASLTSCINGCAPEALGCITRCGTDLACWVRCGGRAAASCVLACVDP